MIKLEDQHKIVNFYICRVRHKNEAIQTLGIHPYHHFINKRHLNSKYRKGKGKDLMNLA